MSATPEPFILNGVEPIQHSSSPNRWVPWETRWRQFADCEAAQTRRSPILTSRWTSGQVSTREEIARTDKTHHLVCMALCATSLEFRSNTGALHQGRVLPGMVQVSGPDETMWGVFEAPCDFLHLWFADWYVADCCRKMSPAGTAGSRLIHVSGFHRDRAIEQLARAILACHTAAGDLNTAFVEGIAISILIRLLTPAKVSIKTAPTSRVSPLARWRLNRVREFVDANLARPIKLSDMADAAGLTRMHFAAQFRSATGLRPRDYLLKQRIHRAQLLLASKNISITEVAFSIGFENQAHFSTVFRRLTGETPTRWRQLGIPGK